ncbi:hypothetical protein STEG23_027668 [Scotinomys teguina]
MNPEPVLAWTLNGKPCRTGEKLFIRRLSPEQLGTYLCIAKNTDKELVSQPVTVSLRHKCPPDLCTHVEATGAPTAAAPTAGYPTKPDDILSLSGGSAIGLIVAATLGGLVLLGAICFYLVLALKERKQKLCPESDTLFSTYPPDGAKERDGDCHSCVYSGDNGSWQQEGALYRLDLTFLPLI